MSSEYFCKVALARVNSRGSRQLNKQANAAMKLKKAITGQLGGMLAGAGLAGGVGLRSIRGLQQDLVNKTMNEATHTANIKALANELAAAKAPFSEKVINSMSNNYGLEAGGALTKALTSNAADKAIGALNSGNAYLNQALTTNAADRVLGALNKGNSYLSGVYTRLAETFHDHPFF